MGVAAAYLAEMVTEDMKTVGGSHEPPSKIVVVAPQEGQVRMRVDVSVFSYICLGVLNLLY